MAVKSMNLGTQNFFQKAQNPVDFCGWIGYNKGEDRESLQKRMNDERGVIPLEQEQDLVVFTDDAGNELTLEVLDYFFYNGQEYAVLADYDEECEDEECACHHHCEEEGCNQCEDQCEHPEQSLYIMKVIPVEDDQEEFVPVEDELMDQLIEVVQTRFEELEDEEGDEPEDE